MKIMKKNIEFYQSNNEDVATTPSDAKEVKSQQEVEDAVKMLEEMRESAKQDDDNNMIGARKELRADFGELDSATKISAEDFVESAEAVKPEQKFTIKVGDKFITEQKVELPQKEKKYKPRLSERLQNFAKPIVLALGMSFAAGAGAQATEQRGTPEPKNDNIAEQGIDSQEQIKLQKDKAFLKEVFQQISGGIITKTESGNLALQAGGKCYEINSSGLQELMDIASRHRTGLEQSKNNIDIAKTSDEKGQAQKKYLSQKNASTNFIVGKIAGDKEHAGIGRGMSANETKGILKQYEASKEQAKKDMSEGSIIQPY